MPPPNIPKEMWMKKQMADYRRQILWPNKLISLSINHKVLYYSPQRYGN